MIDPFFTRLFSFCTNSQYFCRLHAGDRAVGFLGSLAFSQKPHWYGFAGGVCGNDPLIAKDKLWSEIIIDSCERYTENY